jgi:D-ribulokinase
VLLGAAMLGAVAGAGFESVREAMATMSAIGPLSERTAAGMNDFHRSKRHVHELTRKLERDARHAMHQISIDHRR